MKQIKSLFLGLILILLVSIVGCNSSEKKGPSQLAVAEFAKCLTDSGTTMYGAFWCPHCANTKKRFGSAFQFINYVECDPKGENAKPELCLEQKVESYDTWIFPYGTRTVGEPSWNELSQGSGCPLPVGYVSE